MASGEELQGRLTHIAVKVMELCDYCQRHSPGAILANNSSGREPPPRRITQRHGAESRSDFIHKLGVVRKELNESLVWLRMLERRTMAPAETIGPLRIECDELCRIISASRKTAEGNMRKEKLG
jgi:four helix bundle protein